MIEPIGLMLLADQHRADLVREATAERLADLVRRPARPSVKKRLAARWHIMLQPFMLPLPEWLASIW